MNDPIVSDPHLYRNAKNTLEPKLLNESWNGVDS
jgi:hypothetical protein